LAPQLTLTVEAAPAANLSHLFLIQEIKTLCLTAIKFEGATRINKRDSFDGDLSAVVGRPPSSGGDLRGARSVSPPTSTDFDKENQVTGQTYMAKLKKSDWGLALVLVAVRTAKYATARCRMTIASRQRAPPG
jgi:hypothetical protein